MDKQRKPHSDYSDIYYSSSLFSPARQRELDDMMTTISREMHKAFEAADPRLGSPTKMRYMVREVAELTGRSQYAIRKMIDQGELKANYPPGGGLFILREEVAKLLPDEPGEEDESKRTDATEDS